MNEEPQLPFLREAFYRRERRSVPRARAFAHRALADWGAGARSGDGEVRLPVPRPDNECGRGLLLVAAYADKWGVGERDPGKVVWCEFGVGCAG